MNQQAQIYKDTKDELLARKYFTRDFKELVAFDKHLVLIYDDLKHGFPSHHETDGFDFMGEGYTWSSNFVMRNAGNHPIIFEIKGQEQKSIHWATHVLGHVFICSPYDIVHLDGIMDNGQSHKRVLKHIVLCDQDSPYKSGMSITQSAWIYIADDYYREQMKFTSIASAQIKRNSLNLWQWRHPRDD